MIKKNMEHEENMELHSLRKEQSFADCTPICCKVFLLDFPSLPNLLVLRVRLPTKIVFFFWTSFGAEKKLELKKTNMLRPKN